MKEQVISIERVFSIFSELNKIPRPSHHEERVADYLCQFAERLNLAYPASKGYEGHEPIVLLNHIDMSTLILKTTTPSPQVPQEPACSSTAYR